MPVIGFLSSLAHSDLGLVIPGFHQGLNEVGFIEGRNITSVDGYGRCGQPNSLGRDSAGRTRPSFVNDKA
jgi:hypothetical protein